MMGKFFLAIEGLTGVGKTSLAKLLKPIFNAELILELGQDNPYLKYYFQDKSTYGLPSQLYFLLDRFHQYQILIPEYLKTHNVISDHLFSRDWIFACLALEDESLDAYKKVYQCLAPHIPHPDLVIILYASNETLLKRLKNRGDDTDIWAETFLEKLRKAYDEFFTTYSDARCICINTEGINYLESPESLNRLVKLISDNWEYVPFGKKFNITELSNEV